MLLLLGIQVFAQNADAYYEAGFEVEEDLPNALRFYEAAESMGYSDATPAVFRLRSILELDENRQLEEYHDNGELWRLTTFKDGTKVK